MLIRPGVAAILTLGLLGGCQLDAPAGPEATIDRLASALAAGDLAGVPTDTADAAEQYAAILEPLGDEVAATVEAGEATTEDDAATAELAWSWDLGGTAWEYTSEVALTRVEEAWRVTWSPTLVEPSLVAGEAIDVDPVSADRGDILGAGDRPIVTARDVVRLGLDKTKVEAAQVPASARAIARALDVDAAGFAETARAAGPQAFVEALVMRAEEARTAVPASYAEVPGAVALPDHVPLAPTRSFAAPILGTVGQATAEIVEESEGLVVAGDVVGLSGLQSRYDEQLAGTKGLQVQAVPAEGEARTLYDVPPAAGTPLRTTLDLDLQARAEDAVSSVAGPASALVAIRPSDGAILAAASGPGGGGLNTATFGQYAPGSTFKVVSSLALLRSGLTPESTVPCTPTVTVDGKDFKNYDDYPGGALGRITLRRAVANSCNTAFISQRGRLGAGDLGDAAAALGLGVDHDLGFPAYFGQVPPPEGETEKAADLIGQGKVLASPMAMATVAASVAAGRTVLPSLLPDHQVAQEPVAVPLTGQEAGALRSLMRAVVLEGSGSFLAGLPGEIGAKTGTAEYGEPGPGGALPTHAWMIATRGDLAVAVFVETGESGSRTAGPLLQGFLS
jgi:cell division protein FtsI/penicillin-binding protein 2